MRWLPTWIITLFCSLTLAGPLGAGCAASHLSQRDQLLQDHVYHQPIQQVWEVVELVLSEKGYLRQTNGTHRLQTDWQSNHHALQGPQAPSICKRHRYHVHGQSLRDGRATIRVVMEQECTAAGKVHTLPLRDLNLEWEVFRRLEPEQAQDLPAQPRSQKVGLHSAALNRISLKSDLQGRSWAKPTEGPARSATMASLH